MVLLYEVALLLRAGGPPVGLHAPTRTRPPLVVLAGTQTWEDVVDDVSVAGATWSGGGVVHGGFARRTHALLPEVAPCARRHASSLVLAGHSVGGACAVLMACHLARQGVRVRAVYTFGTPKCADATFCAAYRRRGLWERTWRYTTERDPVPHLPPLLYRHVGRPVIVPCDAPTPVGQHSVDCFVRHFRPPPSSA